MYGIFLSAILVAVAAQAPSNAQTASAAESKPPVVASMPKASEAPSRTELSPSSAIVTIHGLCSDAKPSKADPSACATIITKAQFDAVVKALEAIGPALLPSQRRSVAEGYTTTLLNYEAAKKAGVERDPRFAEVMRLARMRAMSDMYTSMMAEKAMKVSEKDIETYYRNNRAGLEELTMRRIAIPRYNSANLKDEAYTAKARKLAEEMHDRAAKGEDMDKLEKEALDALGVKDPPKTIMAPIRRGMYEAEQEKMLFALKPGEVAKTIEQPGTFIIFRLEKRETPTLEKAKDEIKQKLIRQHMDQQEEARKKNIKIDFNEAYVGPSHPSGWTPIPSIGAPQAKSPARSKAVAKNAQAAKK